jgi:hypothetical protein
MEKSFSKLIQHIFRPYSTLLGNIPGTEFYKDVKLYKDVNFIFISSTIIIISSKNKTLGSRIAQYKNSSSAI